MTGVAPKRGERASTTSRLALSTETVLDDRTTRYVVAMQPVFDRIQQAAGLVSGRLLLLAAGSPSCLTERSTLEFAGELRNAAAEGLRDGRIVPEMARHHRRHLADALVHLDHALANADTVRPGIPRNGDRFERVTRSLRAALAELHWASNALPGFEVVAIDRSCCACHAFARRSA